MLLDVSLVVETRSGTPVTEAQQILRVRPRDGFGQSVERLRLTVTPEPSEARTEPDFFGNSCDHLAFAAGHRTLRLEMRARIRALGPAVDADADDLSLGAIEEAARTCRDDASLSPVHFLGFSRMLGPAPPALAAYGEPHLGDPSRPARAAVLDLSRAIRADFRYAPGSTAIDTPVEAVMAARAGVCQDFSHLMIAALRERGIPAAYASGFLRTDPPPGRPRLAHADAMHAWVLVWLGADAGWVGFDPTNGIAATRDHVLVAVGRDYADVSPVSGTLVASGRQDGGHWVDVVPVDKG